GSVTLTSVVATTVNINSGGDITLNYNVPGGVTQSAALTSNGNITVTNTGSLTFTNDITAGNNVTLTSSNGSITYATGGATVTTSTVTATGSLIVSGATGILVTDAVTPNLLAMNSTSDSMNVSVMVILPLDGVTN